MNCLLRILLMYFSCSLYGSTFSFISAQTPIQNLGLSQGLSNNSVRCIYQDHNGVMWFGTYDGLNMYDGYSFKVFRNKLNDTTSIPHNYIYCIDEDKQNNLWVGTGQGIGIYSNLTQNFRPVYYMQHDTRSKEKITHNVNCIKTDAEGNTYIGTNGFGLLVKRKSEEVAIQIPLQKNILGRSDYNVRDLVIDKKQKIWLFINSLGLCLFDLKTETINLVNNSIKNANCLESDDKGELWIGTDDGLYKYSIASDSFAEKISEEYQKLPSNNVASLHLDKSQKLWIGTDGGGIAILNTINNQFSYLLPGEQKGMLNSESVFDIYEDNESRTWIGTLKGGINVFDPNKNSFKVYTHDPLNKNSVAYNFVSSFFEDDNNLWIGTDGGGLSIWDRNVNQYSHYRHMAGDPHSLSHNYVSCILKDHLGNKWIATFGGGVNKFNPANGTFEHYRCFNDSTGEENKNAWLLYEDHNKNLWATTFIKGKLYRFDRALNRFVVFDQKLNDLISMIEDRFGNLWAGNSHELIKIDRLKGNHAVYEIGKPVRSIHEAQNGNFWIGTEGGGLILFDRDKGNIVARYSDADGLCNNSVLNILEDDKGGLWLSTFNGLSNFTPQQNFFKNYYSGDGLQSNQFLYNTGLKLRSGEMVFGGINGFNLFKPSDVQPRSHMPPVMVTGIFVNSKPVSEVNQYIIKRPGDERITELKIPYNQAVLTFQFTALEYTSPEKIKYAYFLEGWDKEWSYTGNVRTVNYNNISEGNYTLHVKSTNAEGVWNKNEAIIKIKILPPWYRTWWAYLLYLSLAVSLIYFYLRYKARQTRLQYEVKLAHIETEKEKELNEKKISFFTDISHEFRAPLTLIINPIKDILKNYGKKTDADLNIVYRNARRLLSLVDQLLLFQKAGTEGDTIKVSKLEFISICRNIYLSFVNLAKSKKIDYQFISPEEDIELYGDREKIEIIFFNLLSNAIKYTPDGGKVVFEISETNSEIEIIVSDTGAGIPEAVGEKIFERFYQVKESSSAAKPGIGIGLYLVKHFTEQHKGKIVYESVQGEGTVFRITLLTGIVHFNGMIQLDNTPVNTLASEIIEEQESTVEKKAGNLDELVTDKKSILIVEDNEEVRNYVAGIFKDKFTVYEAESGDKGYDMTQKYLPDIIISDVMMENGNGIELCHKIKSDDSINHTPVILLTAVDSSEVKLKGVETGADDYITKPFEKELLIARVDNLLKTRNRLQSYFYDEITLKKHDLKISSEYKDFLERCISIVEEHLDDDDFNIRKLAGKIGMSHSNLYRKVKSISGQSINAFIRFIRLRKAAGLMIKTTGNINEIAFQVGISDIKYFRKQFQLLFGMNPSEYIRKYRSPFNKDYSVSDKITKPERY